MMDNKPNIAVYVHTDGNRCEPEIRTYSGVQYLHIGGLTLVLDAEGLARLRDVIAAHLASLPSTIEQKAA